MWKIIFFSFIFSSALLAQSHEEQFNKQLEEIMKARAEMLRSLMDDSMSGDLEKRMEEMMKNFSQNGDFGFGQMEAPVIGEYDWVETETSKILKIKVKQIKDRPLDIKIQNNEIKIKGDVETSEVKGKNQVARKVSFERIFRIPDDVDKTGPEFENGKDGFMQIKFKKLKVKKGSNAEGRVPVTPDSTDLSI